MQCSRCSRKCQPELGMWPSTIPTSRQKVSTFTSFWYMRAQVTSLPTGPAPTPLLRRVSMVVGSMLILFLGCFQKSVLCPPGDRRSAPSPHSGTCTHWSPACQQALHCHQCPKLSHHAYDFACFLSYMLGVLVCSIKFALHGF